jgi:hypothetical protein
MAQPEFAPSTYPGTVVSFEDQQRRAAMRDLEAQRAAFAEAEAEDQRVRARMARLEAALGLKLGQAMPTASELNVDVTGLQPARARLVCGGAWIERERAEIVALEGKLAAFMVSLGAPAATKAEIERAEGLVSTALRKFFNGGSVGTPPDMRKVEREALVEKLAADDATAAEIAGGLMAEVEEQIEVQREFVTRLEQRLDVWRGNVLIEVGQPIAAKIDRLMQDLKGEVAALVALGCVVTDGSLRSIADGTRISLGVNKLPYDIAAAEGLSVPGGDQVEPITAEWRAALRKIEKDSRAPISPPRSRVILPPPKAKPAAEPVFEFRDYRDGMIG